MPFGCTSAAALACSGASFKAVDATGQLGGRIADHTATLDTWANTCGELNDLTPRISSLRAALLRTTDLDASSLSLEGGCVAVSRDGRASDWRSNSRTIKQIALALAAYSAKMSAVANGKDLSFGKPEAAAIASIGIGGWTQDSTNTKIVEAVVKLFSEAYRHKQLVDIITETGPYIEAAVAELDAACDIERQNILGLRDRIQALDKSIANDALRASLDDAGRPVDLNIPPVSGLLIAAVRRLYAEQSGQMAAVDSLQTSVDAFGRAHAALVANKDKLDAPGTLNAVFAAFSEVFMGAGGPADGGVKD